MDAVKGIGGGIKKGLEGAGNALRNAGRGAQGNSVNNADLKRGGSGNPIEKGGDQLNKVKEGVVSGAKAGAESVSDIFKKGDSVEMSDEAGKEKGKEEVCENTGDIASLIKNIGKITTEKEVFGKAGEVGIGINMIMSAIENDGYINAYDVAPSWLVNAGLGKIGDDNKYDTIIC
jgi:hypothetical protein